MTTRLLLSLNLVKGLLVLAEQLLLRLLVLLLLMVKEPTHSRLKMLFHVLSLVHELLPQCVELALDLLHLLLVPLQRHALMNRPLVFPSIKNELFGACRA